MHCCHFCCSSHFFIQYILTIFSPFLQLIPVPHYFPTSLKNERRKEREKQKQNKQPKIKAKINNTIPKETKNSHANKNKEYVLCWPATSEHGGCPAVCLVFPVEKLSGKYRCRSFLKYMRI